MGKYQLINLGLLATVFGLLALVWWNPGEQEAAPVSPRLSERDPRQARHLRIERPGAEVMELEKDAQGEWRLVKPLQAAANPVRVQNLLNLLGARSFQRFGAAGLNLSEFGLQPPQAVLWIDDLKLEFGGLAPIGGRRYLRLGDTVHLLADSGQYSQLPAEAASLAALSPLGREPLLEAVQTPAYHLFKQENTWRLQAPEGSEPALSSVDTLNRLVQEWRHLQAFSVHAYVPESEPPPRVTVRLAGRELTLLVAARTPDLILADPQTGVAYHFPSQLAANLLEWPQDAPE